MTLSFTTLPPEIHRLIVGNFDPGCLETGSRCLIRSPHRKRRAALCNLCLTSRRLNSIAIELLYRHVVLTTARKCISFLCTLLYVPRLRQYIRSFCCLADFSVDYKTPRRMYRQFISRLERAIMGDFESTLSLDDRAKEVLVQVSLLHDEAGRISVPWNPTQFLEYVVSAILLLPLSLEDLLIELPQFDVAQNWFPDPAAFTKMEDALSNSELSWGPVLGSMRTLRLQGNPKITRVPDDFGILPSFIPQLFQYPNIKRVDFYGDNGNLQPFKTYDGRSYCREDDKQSIDQLSRSVPVPGQIEEIGLYQSRATPGMVKHFLQRFNGVNRFSWTFRQLNWEQSGEVNECSLNESLDPLCDTLRDLRVESFTTGTVIDELLNYDHLLEPPFRFDVLTSLNKFRSIQTLVIDLMTLASPFHQTRLENKSFNLSSLLPPNLARLELIERSMDDTFGYIKLGLTHDRWLCDVLRLFAEDCSTKMPLLRTFVFRAFKHRIILPSSFRSSTSIEDLTEAFKKANVEFIWQWETIETLIDVESGFKISNVYIR
ncbi:hypothetical protein F5Y04DRAFT_253273 [Hypomontagnella monticulosa]|nr:hypothetical protein F5Y04DRAFT_253273 [Hypomontagnella monticulosa]